MGHSTYPILKKKFEDTKGVIRNSKSKDRQHNGKKKEKKRTKGQTAWVNVSAPEG